MYPTDWTLRRLLAEADLPVVAPETLPDVPIRGLADDSRRVSPGFCFAAIHGRRLDGHDFVDAAVRGGATVVVTERPVSVPDSVAAVRVPDARLAVARLAAAYYGVNRCRNGRRIRLVGITGTNGKSTTCQVLQAILETAGHLTAAVGTLGHGLPESLVPAQLTTPPPIELCAHLARAADAGASYAVMEVSSHALDQHRCGGLSFDVAVFTNLTGDHADYHRTPEAYLRAKKRLFDQLGLDAVAIVNDDDPAAADMVADCRAPVVRYGLSSPRADVTAEIRSTLLSGSELEIRFGRSSVLVPSALIGRHNASNVLAAAGAAFKLGIRAEDVVRGVARVKAVRGRLERVEPEACPIAVLVDYAHTDDALENALSALVPLTVGRLICVFGCGGDRDQAKRPRMGAVVGRLADVAVITSDNPRTEPPMDIIDQILPGIEGHSDCEVHVEPDRRRAIRSAVGTAVAGDIVLIAGKGHEDYQILGYRTVRFDDAEEARQMLSARWATGDASGPRLTKVGSV